MKCNIGLSCHARLARQDLFLQVGDDKRVRFLPGVLSPGAATNRNLGPLDGSHYASLFLAFLDFVAKYNEQQTVYAKYISILIVRQKR